MTHARAVLGAKDALFQSACETIQGKSILWHGLDGPAQMYCEVVADCLWEQLLTGCNPQLSDNEKVGINWWSGGFPTPVSIQVHR